MSERKARIEQVNDYWNRRMPYDPYEGDPRSLAQAVTRGGKCHDFVKAKAAGLTGAGFAEGDMQVGIGVTTDTSEPHSVLIVDGMVMDNRTSRTYSVEDAEKHGLMLTDRLAYGIFGK